MKTVKEPRYYSPDDLEERQWITPDDFISLNGKYKGYRFRMLNDGLIILISKNGDDNAKAD